MRKLLASFASAKILLPEGYGPFLNDDLVYSNEPLSSVDPNMGLNWLVSAFMLVMVSGHSMTSLLLTCLVFGTVQVLVSTFISPVLGGLAIAVLAAFTLRIRPKGLTNG